MPRERRKWTEEEDAILRDAVAKEPVTGTSSLRASPDVLIKTAESDGTIRLRRQLTKDLGKLQKMKGFGQQFKSMVVVAQVVKTRNGDQCSKRWYDALDPSIDHSPWTSDEDVRLLEAISKHGRNWKAIVKAYFPRRTSLSAKNRYSLLIRKMEPKCKQSHSSVTRKASLRPPNSKSVQLDQQKIGHSIPTHPQQNLPEDLWVCYLNQTANDTTRRVSTTTSVTHLEAH
ncbi:hypothetical protein Q9L58_008008 [Maublancomyces gigas]|uniref:Uncharacterized protein n=1 Tax=Discina gigas TaxID=1032678 RepID=A0ABR3GB67_9PEZI